MANFKYNINLLSPSNCLCCLNNAVAVKTRKTATKRHFLLIVLCLNVGFGFVASGPPYHSSKI